MRLEFIKNSIITLFTLVFLITSHGAWAQCVPDKDDCIPGLPCNVCLEENDPEEPDDGPNSNLRSGTTLAPNEPKHGGSEACDADLMNQIYAQSFMQSQRSTIMAEHIIRKPDSVLEYSCFDQMASLVATVGGPIFTESRQWDNQQVPIWGTLNQKVVDDVRPVFINTYMEDDRLDISFREVILKSLAAYYEGSFAHRFLGGTSPLGDTNTNTIDIHQGGYNCSWMNLVYHEAKCRNMNEDDPFLSFQDLTQLDPRVFPEGYECESDEPLIEPEIIALGDNENREYAAFDELEDIYITEMTAGRCNTVGPIPTGLRFTTQDIRFNADLAATSRLLSEESYEEHICPKPGCYYDGTTCN